MGLLVLLILFIFTPICCFIPLVSAELFPMCAAFFTCWICSRDYLYLQSVVIKESNTKMTPAYKIPRLMTLTYNSQSFQGLLFLTPV